MGRVVDSDAENDCAVIDNVVINGLGTDSAAIGVGTDSGVMIGHATMRWTVDGMGWGLGGDAGGGRGSRGLGGGGRGGGRHGGGRLEGRGGGRGRTVDRAGPPLAHSFGLSSDRVGAPPAGERLGMAPSVGHRATLEQAQRRLGIQPDGVDVPVHIGRRGLPTTLWWHLADVPCVSHQRTSTGKASRP